jgi:hypothetical protein
LGQDDWLTGTVVGIVDKYIVWSPYATTPAGQYVLKLQDTTGAIAYSNIFNMIVAGSSSSTTRVSSLVFPVSFG